MLFVYFEDDLDDTLDYKLNSRVGDTAMRWWCLFKTFWSSKLLLSRAHGEEEKKKRRHENFLVMICDNIFVLVLIVRERVWLYSYCVYLKRNLSMMMRCCVWFHISLVLLCKSRLKTYSKLSNECFELFWRSFFTSPN